MSFRKLQTKTVTKLEESIKNAVKVRKSIYNLVKAKNMVLALPCTRTNLKKLRAAYRLIWRYNHGKETNPEIVSKSIVAILSNKKENLTNYEPTQQEKHQIAAEVEIDRLISELNNGKTKIENCILQAKEIPSTDFRYKKLEADYDNLLAQQESTNVEFANVLEAYKRYNTAELVDRRLEAAKNLVSYQKCSFVEAQYKYEELHELEQLHNDEKVEWEELRDYISNGEKDTTASQLTKAVENALVDEEAPAKPTETKSKLSQKLDENKD